MAKRELSSTLKNLKVKKETQPLLFVVIVEFWICLLVRFDSELVSEGFVLTAVKSMG